MQIKDTHKLLKELKEILCQIYDENLEGLYLYGSYVNGEEDAESDIDIAIVLKDFWDYWEEIQRTGQAISALSLKYDVSISPIRIKKTDWTHEDSPFFNNVRKECVPL